MPSSFTPNEQTVISKRVPLPAPSELLVGSRPSQIGKSLEGQQLGQFTLEEFVGGGGMGAVFRAIDQTLDRIVAVKVVSSEQTDEDTLRRFRNEAQSAARLDHPNIARVYSVGEESGWNYIVFEFIEGVNVRDLVAHKGPLPLDEAISYIVQVADALEHASQRDVVHRDIKPSNLLVMQDGRAKLVDMGLARLHHVESSAEDLTATGVTLGTFDYISPEQARDPRDTDVRSDLYSLGCTFYYMLTGVPPFPEGTVLQKLLSHSSESPPDPRDLRADLPEEVSAIAMKLMAKLPTQRHQRPSELTAELMKLCEQLGFVAPTTRGLILPSQESLTGKITHHLPWIVPICLLFAIVFGVDAMLPQAATVTHSDMMPKGLAGPIVPERKTGTGDQDQQPPPAIDHGIRSASDAGEQSPKMNDPQPDVETPTSEVPELQSDDPPSVPPVESDAPSEDESELPPLADLDVALRVTGVDATLDVGSDTAATLSIGSPSATDAELRETIAATADSPIEATIAAERLYVIPEGPPTPDPMVVRTLDNALRRLAEYPGVRTIEMRCNRLEVKPLTIDLRNDLTIEAGEGFSPLLIFDQRGVSTQEKRMVHILGGQLTLRGIHFRVNLPYASDEGWTLFHLNQVQQLALHRCTMTVQNDDGAVPGNDVPVSPRPNLVLQSCIARGQATFVRATDGLPFKLEFTQGLIATTERMVELGQIAESVRQEIARVTLRHVTVETEQGLCRATMRDAEARFPQLLVDAEYCLFDHSSSVPLIEHVGMRDATEATGHALKLSGQLNAFPRTDIIWRLTLRDGESIETPWDNRFVSAWYTDEFSDHYARWLEPNREAERVMHEVTADDYLLVDEGDLGFDPTLLPELPSEILPADNLD